MPRVDDIPLAMPEHNQPFVTQPGFNVVTRAGIAWLVSNEISQQEPVSVMCYAVDRPNDLRPPMVCCVG